MLTLKEINKQVEESRPQIAHLFEQKIQGEEEFQILKK